jgi:hypothetical protein
MTAGEIVPGGQVVAVPIAIAVIWVRAHRRSIKQTRRASSDCAEPELGWPPLVW